MHKKEIPNFLADTCWFGLTDRFSDEAFKDLVSTRSKQGFDAVQVVMGVPPEVGINHPSARGGGESAFTIEGEQSEAYIDQAQKRLEVIKAFGMVAVIYGAWGHQIDWIGQEKMIDWWNTIIKTTEHFDPIYCLTGESDIWATNPKRLLPDKTTEDLTNIPLQKLPLPQAMYGIAQKVRYQYSLAKQRKRAQQWGSVLSVISQKTDQPIICHTTPAIDSTQATNKPGLLDVVTIQTGHSQQSREMLWRYAIEHPKNRPFINLEPWYEQILDQFGEEDQLYAYWVSMLAGAHAYCYGSQGVWNYGDREFLARWGKTTFEEALQSEVPQKIGDSHKILKSIPGLFSSSDSYVTTSKKGYLQKISRRTNTSEVSFIPDVTVMPTPEKKEDQLFYIPATSQYVDTPPRSGAVVIISHY